MEENEKKQFKKEILELIHDLIVFNDPKIIEEELLRLEGKDV